MRFRLPNFCRSFILIVELSISLAVLYGARTELYVARACGLKPKVDRYLLGKLDMLERLND
jgi:hypothetical protein